MEDQSVDRHIVDYTDHRRGSWTAARTAAINAAKAKKDEWHIQRLTKMLRSYMEATDQYVSELEAINHLFVCGVIQRPPVFLEVKVRRRWRSKLRKKKPAT